MSRRCWICVPLLLMCVFLVACGGSKAVTSLSITPNSATLNAGNTVQFKATASFIKSNQTQFTQDVTSQVTWSSANTSVLTIDSTGLAKGVAAGTTSVVVSLKNGDQSSTAQAAVTVNDVTAVHQLLSITISPASQTLTAINQTAQFVAIGNFSSAPTTQDLTSQVKWTSSSEQVATINTPPSSSPGLATAKGSGIATITATGTSATGAILIATATLNVNIAAGAVRDLVSVSIIPTSQTLTAVGQTAKFTAVGTFTNAPITAVIDGQTWLANPTWDSSVQSVATINSAGVATGTGPGTTVITATAPTASGPKAIGIATLTESATSVSGQGHDLLSISVIPTQQGLTNTGMTAQFIAVGTYATAPLINFIPNGVTWASSSQQIARIDALTGLATAVGPGIATMTATYTDPLSNGQRTLVGQGSLAIAPGNEQVPLLTVIKLGPGAATTIFSNPTSINCGSTCTATFPAGSFVQLTASTPPASWSNNCLPDPITGVNAANLGTSADGLECTVQMATSTIVGAIFN